jgi:hypothetical protein
MMNPVDDFFALAKAIQKDVAEIGGPPEEGLASATDRVVLRSLTRNTRGYIEKIANQANGAYENGWYDACAVMLRRLLETLIIEAFENHSIAEKIKDRNGDFVFLSDLIKLCLDESAWNLGRNCRKAMGRLKDLGDRSAHSRRFVAHRGDVDLRLDDVRIVVQELLFLAGMK